MPSRVQQLVLGLGKAKQADIVTPSASFLRFKKIDMSVTSPKPVFESDAAEIGKGHEFPTATFPSHYEVQNRIEKYASSEFLAWAVSYGLGNVVKTGTAAPWTYTVTPINPGTGLELPYFSVAEQIAEGGGSAVDNLFVGCAIEDFTYQFSYGPGRASSKMLVNWVGSGKLTQPSAVTVPALTVEHGLLAGSMSLTVNGVNYVTAKTILSGSIGWKNNLLLNAGFFPGSGTQNGLQIRGRLEIGVRQPTFQFTTRLLSTSTEYALLTAQTAGAAVLNIVFDSGNQATFTYPQLAFEMVEQTEVDGIVAVTVTGTPESASPLNAVILTGVDGIAV